MAKRNSRRTLFFINDVAPTDEEQDEIDATPGTVCVRNARKFREEDSLEDFDFVAGEVPEKYAVEAARREAAAEGAPVPPKAETTAPAAPQQVAAGVKAVPGNPAPATAWKPN